MKTMKLQVHGTDVMIDYENENVTYNKSTSDEMVEVINGYLMNEGFLDDEYISLMKAR